MKLSKKIIREINNCTIMNNYTIYVTTRNNVLYITNNDNLLKLKPKTSRDLLYQMFLMLESKHYENDKYNYFFNNEKKTIISVYYNDYIEDYCTQLIFPIIINDTIYGSVVIASNKKIDFTKIYNDIKLIAIKIKTYWLKELSSKKGV